MCPRLLASAALVALLLGGDLAAEEPLKSGPPVGAKNNRSGFFPKWVTGPGAGQNLCPVWYYKHDLVALIFVREASDPLTGLVKKIDQRVDAAGKYPRVLGTYVIFYGDPAAREKQLREMAEKQALKRVSLGVGAPPDAYQVAAVAEVTVVIYTVGRRNQQTVAANFAFRKGELDEAKADAVVEALSRVLPK